MNSTDHSRRNGFSRANEVTRADSGRGRQGSAPAFWRWRRGFTAKTLAILLIIVMIPSLSLALVNDNLVNSAGGGLASVVI
jgi:hypothetical protein